MAALHPWFFETALEGLIFNSVVNHLCDSSLSPVQIILIPLTQASDELHSRSSLTTPCKGSLSYTSFSIKVLLYEALITLSTKFSSLFTHKIFQNYIQEIIQFRS